ncbi:hypothetical protein DAPPUDRAFT_268313 [Daphnia pulex]|uniref:Uncharacterized protein n=1 Tax=Daphnia pulex TaxID=6669 RepID=E9HXM2_DAPPU|nr:hypothetical protein DAPPUDRAFT_268313 [Daphnia pulex]|eukprot:EFX63506.1 hypothetical protein DAPPUDRAFT_268313 [Daphnia pulex]
MPGHFRLNNIWHVEILQCHFKYCSNAFKHHGGSHAIDTCTSSSADHPSIVTVPAWSREVAVAEGWTNAQHIQVAARRLLKTALDWHIHIGHAHATWNAWSLAFTANFSPRLHVSEWLNLVEDMRQKNGEWGIEYTLDKHKVLRVAPIPINEEKMVAFFIDGLASWQHVAAMTANRPANVTEFIQRMRELETLGVASRVVPSPVHGPVAPPWAPPVAPPAAPIATPPVAPPSAPDLNATLAAFGNHIRWQLEILVPGVEEAEVIVVEEVELDVAEENGLIQAKENATTLERLVISLAIVQQHREKIQPEARSRNRAHRLRIYTLSTPTPACKENDKIVFKSSYSSSSGIKKVRFAGIEEENFVCNEEQNAIIEVDPDKTFIVQEDQPDMLACTLIHPEEANVWKNARVGENLSAAERDVVFKLLARRRRCFPPADGNLGSTDMTEHAIDTGNERPISSVPYRVSAIERRIITEKIAEMLREGIIRPSFSP